jgi:hypothetical protein
MITRLSERHGCFQTATAPCGIRPIGATDRWPIEGVSVRVWMWIDGIFGRNLSWIYMGLVHIDISV